jgi:hypothetical protein
MNSVRPPKDFSLVLEVGWDHSGPNGTIDLEVDVDHEWLTDICVDSGRGADADRGKAGRQLHRTSAAIGIIRKTRTFISETPLQSVDALRPHVA